MLFALLPGSPDNAEATTPRASEVRLMLAGSHSAVEDCCSEWTSKAVTVVQEPHGNVFGRTFVIADPDGDLIRVSLLDQRQAFL